MNSKNSIILVDPDFDVSSAVNCDLLIKVTADNFSYAIIDATDNRLVVLYDYQECDDVVNALSNQLNEDNHLSLSFKTVKASVYTRNVISVPDVLFDFDNLDAYAKFFTVAQSEQLHLQRLNGTGLTSIFNLEHSMEELLVTRFGISRVFDHTAPLLTLAKTTTDKHLTLDFTVGFFTAILTEGGKLIIQNCYESEDSEEFNYYLLLMIHQLGIDTKNTKVSLSGIIHEEDLKYKAIEQYFSDIVFQLASLDTVSQQILDDLPAHYYSSVLALHSCE